MCPGHNWLLSNGSNSSSGGSGQYPGSAGQTPGARSKSMDQPANTTKDQFAGKNKSQSVPAFCITFTENGSKAGQYTIG
jgi:hypothetical protein